MGTLWGTTWETGLVTATGAAAEGNTAGAALVNMTFGLSATDDQYFPE
jgi:hypothetical protein